ncbi:unnamed protein product [Prorocentrum cordatum]|uniref:C-type lectin domain-containing protein n=1 Tax=Prorocentrum cordatum TaxID=2364126 RepID=A0ABN9QVR1_9DINO|nr:unnamed protein product [Polarella glacialis]
MCNAIDSTAQGRFRLKVSPKSSRLRSSQLASSWGSNLRVSPCALAISTTANACLSHVDAWGAPVPLGDAAVAIAARFLLGILAVLAVQATVCTCLVSVRVVLWGFAKSEVRPNHKEDIDTLNVADFKQAGHRGGLPPGFGVARGQPMHRFTERPKGAALQSWIDEAGVMAEAARAERRLAVAGDEPEPAAGRLVLCGRRGDVYSLLDSLATPSEVFIGIGKHGLRDQGRRGILAGMLRLSLGETSSQALKGFGWDALAPALAADEGGPDASAAGRRFCNLRSLADSADMCELVGWMLPGPRTTPHVVSGAAKQSGGPVQRHSIWKQENKLNEDEHSAVAQEMLPEILELAGTYDQVGVSNLASMEALASHMQFIEHKIKKKKKDTVGDFDSQDCYLSHTRRTGGANASPELLKWASESAARVSAILKEDRKAAEVSQPDSAGCVSSLVALPEPDCQEVVNSERPLLLRADEGRPGGAEVHWDKTSKSNRNERVLFALDLPFGGMVELRIRRARCEVEDGAQLGFSIQDVADCFHQFKAPEHMAPRSGAPRSGPARWTQQAHREFPRRGGLGGIESELADRQAAKATTEAGLKLHEVEESKSAVEALGLELDGTRLRARPARAKRWRIAPGTQATLRRRRVAGRGVEKMIDQITQPLLSGIAALINAVGNVFAVKRKITHALLLNRPATRVFRVACDFARQELANALHLLPLLSAQFDAPRSERAACSGAALRGYAAQEADVEPGAAGEAGRRSEWRRFRVESAGRPRETALAELPRGGPEAAAAAEACAGPFGQSGGGAGALDRTAASFIDKVATGGLTTLDIERITLKTRQDYERRLPRFDDFCWTHGLETGNDAELEEAVVEHMDLAAGGQSFSDEGAGAVGGSGRYRHGAARKGPRAMRRLASLGRGAQVPLAVADQLLEGALKGGRAGRFVRVLQGAGLGRDRLGKLMRGTCRGKRHPGGCEQLRRRSQGKALHKTMHVGGVASASTTWLKCELRADRPQDAAGPPRPPGENASRPVAASAVEFPAPPEIPPWRCCAYSYAGATRCQEARQLCGPGQRLAMPKTPREKALLQSAVSQAVEAGLLSTRWPSNTIWLGGHWREGDAAQWEWDDGAVIDTSKWTPEQLSAKGNQGHEPCLAQDLFGVAQDSEPDYTFGVMCEEASDEVVAVQVCATDAPSWVWAGVVAAALCAVAISMRVSGVPWARAAARGRAGGRPAGFGGAGGGRVPAPPPALQARCQRQCSGRRWCCCCLAFWCHCGSFPQAALVLPGPGLAHIPSALVGEPPSWRASVSRSVWARRS